MSGAAWRRLPRALLIFLDGVGIGRADASINPFFAGTMPFLTAQLGRQPSMRAARITSSSAVCIPADPCLGVSGLPQSGTGQATLLTGVNCPRLVGRHFGPYLYSTTMPVVAERSIFRRLLEAGVPREELALANAFPRRFFDYLAGHRRRMIAGIHAALNADIPFRGIDHLKAGSAVSTDITAARGPAIGHPDAPAITPWEAGRRLARIAQSHRFTLFEYFATDKAGHDRSHEHAHAVLHDVDELLRGVVEGIDPEETLVCITSDHGNLEDLGTKSHTRNRVPVILFGRDREAVASTIRTLSHITPALCRFVTSHN